MTKEIANLAQIYWACRRGMLELDVLLINFFKEVYSTLSPEKQSLFIHLLEHSDQALYLWLMGKEKPSTENLSWIVEEIRSHAKQRNYHTEAF